MTATFFDTTGVLMLEKVTPVIKAIYGGYNPDAECLDDGTYCIAMTQYGGDSSWGTVIDALANLVQHEDTDSDIEILTSLAKRFGVENDERFSKIIANEFFTGEASIDVLYEIATLFDDGHKISGYLTESAWHSTYALVFGFGGTGTFQGKHYGCTFSSNNAGGFGKEINQDLSGGNLDAAAERIQYQVNKLLNGVVCENQRAALKKALVNELLKS